MTGRVTGRTLTTQTADRTDIRGYLFKFADAGRDFYAIVWIGVQASKRTEDQAFTLLDRLRFRAK